ncbi:MAG: sigma 54-interacting transcriptional regulator [Desulfovibrio sp.]|nr:sigma 54-interacting transcriptional regulator [Desulfovibrio sp.]
MHNEADNERVQARIEKLVNRLPCMVYRCRVGEDYSMTLEYVSAGSEALLGIPAPLMVEKKWNTIERMTLPADIKKMRAQCLEAIEERRPYQMVYRVELPDGSLKWIWDQGEPIYGPDGAILYLEGMLTDVSGQKFLELALQDENRQLKMSMEHIDRLGPLVGKSEAMHKVYSLILRAAETDANVIIYGETGCGKDLVSRAIHNYSGRKGAFVPVNCGAIPENLLESEFFGYAKGAFTGASANKTGFVGAADNGTLFLDEIGELPLHLQVKFLRVLETKSYTPLGTNTPKESSFRLIAATNRDLNAQVKDKTMRADFYYRINVLAITLPPLRDRKEDIPLLIRAWQEHTSIDIKLPHDVRLAMMHYDWPGNVRELHNFLDRYATFGQPAADFLKDKESVLPPLEGVATLAEAVGLVERKMILQALEKSRWHRGKAAQALGLNLRTLQRKMKNLGIRAGDEDQDGE